MEGKGNNITDMNEETQYSSKQYPSRNVQVAYSIA